MTTAMQMTENIGQHGLYDGSVGLQFRVRVIDARVRFGEVDYLVVPADGIGQKWVASHKVKFSEYCMTGVK